MKNCERRQVRIPKPDFYIKNMDFSEEVNLSHSHFQGI